MKYTSLATLVAALFLATDAEARTFRVDQVPNGAEFGCGLCHNNAAGGGLRTGFGEQVFQSLDAGNRASAAVDWSAIYDQDGDSDGYSNGLELGDPDGTWMIGDPDPATFTDPSDRTSTPCGDGILNGNEECDGDPMGATCDDMSLGPGGMVTCSELCRLDFSMCEGFEATNNSTNNDTGNNSTNNDTGNNPTNNDPGNDPGNDTGNEQIDDGFIDDGSADDDAACSTAGSTPGLLALILGLFVAGRRRR